jgi:hypothetical protein
MIYLKIEYGFRLCPRLTGEKEVITIEKRIWIRSGIVEELDQRQQAFLDFVLEKIRFYYRELHGTRPCYRHPLTLGRLRKLCNRSSSSVMQAVRMLANTISYGTDAEPPISYDRVSSTRNKSHRAYRINLQHIFLSNIVFI